MNQQLFSDIPQKSAFQRVSIYVASSRSHKDRTSSSSRRISSASPLRFQTKKHRCCPVIFQKLRLQPDSGEWSALLPVRCRPGYLESEYSSIHWSMIRLIWSYSPVNANQRFSSSMYRSAHTVQKQSTAASHSEPFRTTVTGSRTGSVASREPLPALRPSLPIHAHFFNYQKAKAVLAAPPRLFLPES